MKGLSGWDAVLLYSETPNVHMHTLKVAVIELDALEGRKFGVEEFRMVIKGRLYKLDPFRYALIEIPFKFHHSMWRENCEVDLADRLSKGRLGRHQVMASPPLTHPIVSAGSPRVRKRWECRRFTP